MPLSSLPKHLGFSQKKSPLWKAISEEEFNASHELIGWFLRREEMLRSLNPDVEPTVKLWSKGLDPAVRDVYFKPVETFFEFVSTEFSTRRYKIDLNLLSIFDSFNDRVFSQNNRACVLDELISFLGLFYRHQIGFSHQEVFFVPKGQTPPTTFRPGIDKICDNLEAYSKAVSSFSYQAAKAILNRFAPDESNDLHRLIVRDFSEVKAWGFDDNPALKDIQYYSSAMNAHYIASQRSKELSQRPYTRLAFGPAVSIEQVLDELRAKRFPWKEMTLILKGEQYEDPLVRKKVQEAVIQFAEQNRLTSILQVVLLTKMSDDLTLQDLKPDLSKEKEGYSPLAHEMGYYLSNPALLSSIFRHIQAPNPSVEETWFEKEKASSPTIPSLSFQQGYITSPDPEGHVRASKHASKVQLKSRVALSLVQEVNQVVQENQMVSEEQSLSQRQELSQTQERMQQQRQNVSMDWTLQPFAPGFSDFCDALAQEARRRLDAKDSDSAIPSIYITERYRRAKNQFYTQLLEDHAFRVKLAARIFGTGYALQEDVFVPIYLKDYSVHSISSSMRCFLDNIRQLQDGMYDNERFCDRSVLTGQRVLVFYRNHRGTNAWNPEPIYEVNGDNLYYSPQVLYTRVDPTHHWQSHLSEVVLLPMEDLASVDSSQKAELIQATKALLGLFQPNESLSIEQIKVLEAQFMILNQFYFKDNPDYLRVLSQFMSLFEPPSADFLKIMLQLWINGHKGKMTEFFKLLLYLESKNMLGYFYTLYFQYATHVLSVFNFLRPQNVAFRDKVKLTGQAAMRSDSPYLTHHAFIGLTRLPADSDCQTFGLHVLMFFAQNGGSIDYFEYALIEEWWQHTTLKLLQYTGDQQEAQRLMHVLVQQLVTSEGLNFSPLCEPHHFFVSLNHVIDSAIKHHTLHEQLQELRSLSLMDADFALTYNDYPIVSAEMEFDPGTIDPVTKSYAVSKEALEADLFHHTSSSPSLKRAIFRYLGGQTLREDLALYRTLFARLVVEEDEPLHIAFSEWLIGYMAIQTSEDHYSPQLDETQQTIAAFEWGRRNGLTDEQITHGLRRFWMEYHQLERDELKGSVTLIGITPDYWRGKKKIPAVFMQKFNARQLGRFLFTHQDEIIASSVSDIPHLAETLLQRLIEDHYGSNDIKASKKMVLQVINARYSTLTLQNLMTDLPKIQVFIEQYGYLNKSYAGSYFYSAFKHLINVTPNWDACLICLELLNTMMSLGFQVPIELCQMFLMEVTNRPHLREHLLDAKPLLGKILALFSENKEDALHLSWLFDVAERFLVFEPKEALRLLDSLLQHIHSPEGCAFFKAQSQVLSNDALRRVVMLVDNYRIPIAFMAKLCEEKCDFRELESFLEQCDKTKIQPLFVLVHGLDNRLSQMLQLQRLPYDALTRLANLVSLHALSAEQLVEFVESGHLMTRITAYERALYAQNQARFTVDAPRSKGLIAKIRYQSGEEDDGVPLSELEQAHLLDDYVNMMSYMTINPVLIEEDEEGQITPFTIHQLDDRQFKVVFKHIQHQINTCASPHDYELVLLALSCEAMHRVRLPFPRDTQILVELNALRHKGHLMHGVKTGGGKSIITAFDAVRQCAHHQTVELGTENHKLALDHIRKFSDFYAYLGIDCAKSVLNANSRRREYVDHGVNCSTPGSFDLFHKQMLLEGKKLPTKRSILLDEGDAALGTTVQFRLAASMNPILKDVASWEILYHGVLDFIEEQQLFTENPCSSSQDVTNLRLFCKTKNTTESFARFMDEIPNDLLDELIESAKITDALDEHVDFSILPKTKEKKVYYAAPILENTKRPDLKVSYARAVQQLIHVKLKRQFKERYPFDLDPISETLIVSSIKNYVDTCRMEGGQLCLYTATPGSNVEIKEYHDSHDIKVFKYPSFYDEDLAVDLGLYMADDIASQRHLIHEQLNRHQTLYPDQPYLLITDSPLEAIELTQYLQSNAYGNIQTYLGDDQEGFLEEEVITKAGKEGVITVTTESLARGADFKTQHPRGIFLINACTHLTEAKLIQIMGRVARNGQPGEYLTILNREKLLVAAVEDVNDTFKANQKQISVQELQERLKTRLLEEARDHVITHCLLGLKRKADTILVSQQGSGASWIDQQTLHTTLRDLNDRLETRFSQWLGDRFELEPLEKTRFLEELVALYQSTLNRWITDDTFKELNVIVPPVPLESLSSMPTLNQLTVHDLSLISSILTLGWERVGHQGMQRFWFNLDQLLEQFDPYFKGQQTLKFAIGETIKKSTIVDFKQVLGVMGDLRFQSDAFVDLLKAVPVFGPYLPLQSTKQAIVAYFDTLARNIHEEAWDKIELPRFSDTLKGWYDRLVVIQQLGSVFGTVTMGPIVFMINYILIPTLGSWIKNLLKVIFRNSEYKYAQMLLGLDGFLSDVSVAFTFLSTAKDVQSLKIGDVLDKIVPLLNNKVFIAALTYFLEKQGMTELIVFIEALPKWLDVLQSKRELTLKDLQRAEQVIEILVQGCQLDVVKQALSHTPIEAFIQKLTELSPDFYTQFKQLSLQDLAGFLKLVAHPKFSAFLNQLSGQTTFLDLKLWLNAQSERDIPKDALPAVKALHEYQANRETIAEESIQTLLSLKREFNVSVQDMTHYLDRLHPHTVQEVQPIPPEPVHSTPWTQIIGYSLLALSLIVINLFLMSIPALITSGLFVGYLAYPYIKEAATSFFWTKTQDSSPLVETEQQPIPFQAILPMRVVLCPENEATHADSKKPAITHSLGELSAKFGIYKDRLKVSQTIDPLIEDKFDQRPNL